MLLDLGQPLHLLAGDEAEGSALVVPPGSAAHPVDVGVDVVREVKVDDVRDELEVDPAGHAGLLVPLPLGVGLVLVLLPLLLGLKWGKEMLKKCCAALIFLHYSINCLMKNLDPFT